MTANRSIYLILKHQTRIYNTIDIISYKALCARFRLIALSFLKLNFVFLKVSLKIPTYPRHCVVNKYIIKNIFSLRYYESENK